MRPRCLFSHYGSKSFIAKHYPAPRYDTIVEPFAGGASYSLLYYERQVVLNEINPRVFAIWDYLLKTPLDEVLKYLPDSVMRGEKVSDLLPNGSPLGLVELVRSGINMGSLGRQVSTVVSWFGELHWHQVKQRLEYWLPKIQGHWSVTCGDYRGIQPREATWFIDPPYNNAAGRLYTFSSLDYQELSSWCRGLQGQIIVCENEGASWLPFKPLVTGKSRGGAKRAVEAIWTN